MGTDIILRANREIVTSIRPVLAPCLDLRINLLSRHAASDSPPCTQIAHLPNHQYNQWLKIIKIIV